MAESGKEKRQENLILDKTVYNNKEVDDIINRDFSQLIRSQRPINVERFFTLYRELFYKIQKTNLGLPDDLSSTEDPGDNSHYGLILESQDYLNNYIDWRDKVIDTLFTEIDELETILLNKQFKDENNHPMFVNGTFLRSPARNADGLPIWVMQNGVKREIKNYDTFKSLKRASGKEYDDNDDDVCTQVEISTLDEILDGPNINYDTDINILDLEINDLDITLAGITDYIESEITCLEGVDDPNNMAPFNTTQYSSRFNGCKIEYTSLDIMKPGDSKEIKETIFPGDSIMIKYRNNTDTGISSLNVIEGFTQERILKITNQELRAPIKKDVYGNWVDELGNIIYKYHDLPGVPFGMKKTRWSSYGTQMVQQNSRNLDTSWWFPYNDHDWNNPSESEIQERLFEEVLNDPSNVYYNNTISWNGFQGPRGGLYGEPIYYLADPMGQEAGHNNTFVVKLGTNNAQINDPNAGTVQYQMQYYVILNKDYEPFNQINRVKTSLNHPLTINTLQTVGGYNNLRTMSFIELEQLAITYNLPKELFTNNWRIFMHTSTRSNQKLSYPGFDNI
tara:strand:- start:7339 stop:9030 length:1692 start_codon:yes stop_codon:yes gene_type:complete